VHVITCDFTKGIDLTGLLGGGGIKEDISPPAGSRGGAPVVGLGDEVPPKLKLCCETTHTVIFALKYNKQQLLLLLEKINLA